MALPLRFTTKHLAQKLKHSFGAVTYSVRKCQTDVKNLGCYAEKNPAPMFFDSNVQTTMKDLTGLNFAKVFKHQNTFHSKTVTEFEYMTEQQLEEALNATVESSKKLLQMPPVVKVNIPKTELVTDDPAIEGDKESKMIFADISFGIHDRNRLVLVREANGVLRHGDWDERSRMNAIYNPRERRYYTPPALFESPQLKDALSRKEYSFILDFACAQFEPEDSLYHKTTAAVYNCVDLNEDFEALHSTRHYGPFCFYLAWNTRIHQLLTYYVRNGRVDEGAKLVLLHAQIHSVDHLLEANVTQINALDFIKLYAEDDSNKHPQLNLAIQAAEESLRQSETTSDQI